MKDIKYGNRQPIRRNREQGIALVIALLAMGVLTSVGFALMLSSSTETLIHANFRSSSIAFYASWGGVEEARGRMGPSVADADLIPAPADVDSYTYIRNGNIDPTSSGCTFNGRDCYDPDYDSDTDANPPDWITTLQGNASQVAWTRITLATQWKLNRNLVAPGDPAVDDNTEVCWNRNNLFLPPVDCEDSELQPVFIFT